MSHGSWRFLYTRMPHKSLPPRQRRPGPERELMEYYEYIASNGH